MRTNQKFESRRPLFPLDENEKGRLLQISSYERELAAAGYERVGGVDEAGRGPLAGPVVAAAVILPVDTLIPGLRDSKQLTPAKRDHLFDQITTLAVAVGIGRVDHDTIDEINILQATYLAMEKCIFALKISPQYLLIDALTLRRIFIPQKPIVHGDTLSISIAAASIIAKVTRDRWMDQVHDEFPNYNFKAHKGYGTREHLAKIKQYGYCPIHRKTFRGVVG